MHQKITMSAVLILITLCSFCVAVKAQQNTGKTASSTEVVAVAASPQATDLLPDSLAGVRATGDVKVYGPDRLGEIAASQAPVYQEYDVVSAAARQYGAARVEVYKTGSSFAAFGLYRYLSGFQKAAPAKGEGGAERSDGPVATVLMKQDIVVQVLPDQPSSSKRPAAASTLAAAVGKSLRPLSARAERPPLLDSLPEDSIVAQSERYFLGPESLNYFVDHGRAMFDFAGSAEAVMAEYRGVNPASPNPKLVIVEYHTPQFASDALARAQGFIESLPEQQRNQILIRREGNYIVEALNFQDRQAAEQLINSVKYPYTVKWLRNPLWATNDPFRTQKVAHMLVSTFGLLGLMILSVLVVGGVVGTTIFLKRRKHQREIFSDAGGMLRLDLDPFEATLLGLPAKRSNEE